MKKLHHWILRSCLILCALLLNACLDVHEEFWLHEDGSARAEITCSMPRTATLAMGGPKGVKSMAEDMLADESKINSYKVEVSVKDKRVILDIELASDEAVLLDDLRKSIQQDEELPSAVRKMIGEFNIGIEGLGVSVSRRVSPGEAVPALQLLPKSQLKDYRMVNIMHFPRPISEHNAHRLENGGRTLIWESSLANAIQNPVLYEFVIPIPIPWGWIIGGLAGFLVLVTLVTRWIIKRSRAQQATRTKA